MFRPNPAIIRFSSERVLVFYRIFAVMSRWWDLIIRGIYYYYYLLHFTIDRERCPSHPRLTNFLRVCLKQLSQFYINIWPWNFFTVPYLLLFVPPFAFFLLLKLSITVIKRLAYKLIITAVILKSSIILDVSKVISCLRGNTLCPLRHQSANVI